MTRVELNGRRITYGIASSMHRLRQRLPAIKLVRWQIHHQLSQSVEAEIRQKKEQEREKELAEIRADFQGKKRYGESKFQPGDRVVCLIEGWPYTGTIGQVERALNTKTVYVRFPDGYVTIQGDDKFALQSDGSDDAV
ncbi:hypothetical protein NG799_27085 [Laspinema sp. D1]|uniref:KOW domain-containing protein n=1 Tax=Laspinema palackyanum D2a TaxID=2953684 RepID=A0ABT2MYZ8_9CYAN|nr:hypothetical protein [Laspinema sp. D2a]